MNINGETNIIGLIGNPIKHSFSPQMHNCAFNKLNLNYIYLPFEVQEKNLKKAILGAKSLDIKGLNVTIPHKIRVLKYLDEIDYTAKQIGAVNTIKFIKNQDRIIAKGYNTDSIGAILALKEKTSLKDKNIVICGAGGASRAITFELINNKIKSLILLNRDQTKAKTLYNDLRRNNLNALIKTDSFENIDKYLKNADILIDTTPVGMSPHNDDKAIVRSEQLHSDLLVNDIVYNPLKTSLIKEAETAGCETVSGIKMLLYQGAESFKIWTGINPPLDLMEETLLDIINKS